METSNDVVTVRSAIDVAPDVLPEPVAELVVSKLRRSIEPPFDRNADGIHGSYVRLARSVLDMLDERGSFEDV